MDRATKVFWLLIATLLGASVFFGVRAEQRRRGVQEAAGALASGDLVSFVSTLDGDTVLVETAGHERVTIRILGIKAFDADPKDATEAFGRVATNALATRLGREPVRVLLHATPRDRHGRTLATLFVDDEDVGLALVRDGAAMVFTAFPFPAMPLYLREEAEARAARRGLWADAAAVSRADGLAREWRERAP